MSKYSAEELAAWSGGRWLEEAPSSLSGVSKDSRDIVEGDLYIALRGDRLDGHQFCQQALEAGAAGCLVDKRFVGEGPVGPYLVVDDTTAALSRLATGYRDTWTGPVVGVTGSCGKTTVKEWTAEVLSVRGRVGKTLGNYNNEIGVPVSMLSASRKQMAGIFEVGMNHPGELEPLCRLLKPDIGIVTSVGAGHLGNFDSVDDIAVEKSAMYRALDPAGLAIAHRDNPYLAILQEAVRCELMTVGIDGEGDLVAQRFDVNEVEVIERRTGESAVLPLPQPGEHSVVNVLFATLVGRVFEMGWDEIASGLDSQGALSMRWEKTDLKGVTVINDAYNANPESMRASLKTFAEADAAGAKWAVLGAMRELGSVSERAHEELGAWLARCALDGVVLLGEAASGLAKGLSGADIQVHCAEDAHAGAEFLLGELRSGDNVLLKGSRSERVEEVLSVLSGRIADTGWRE